VTAEPEVLTVKEAAALLRVCEETVRRKAYRGEIPSLKIGVLRFSRQALLDSLRGRHNAR
jgi:excisionase family DNA binding protein